MDGDVVCRAPFFFLGRSRERRLFYRRGMSARRGYGGGGGRRGPRLSLRRARSRGCCDGCSLSCWHRCGKLFFALMGLSVRLRFDRREPSEGRWLRDFFCDKMTRRESFLSRRARWGGAPGCAGVLVGVCYLRRRRAQRAARAIKLNAPVAGSGTRCAMRLTLPSV